MGRSGTGLGLAIVWGTVKDHNGYIDVQTNVEEGTTFTLYFPVTREELAAASAEDTHRAIHGERGNPFWWLTTLPNSVMLRPDC